MSDWVRPLFRSAGASREWHAARSKGLTTVTYCQENIKGPLEVASEDKAEREGRCSRCITLLVAREGTTVVTAVGGRARNAQRKREAQVGQVGAKQGTAKRAVKRPVAKQASGKAALATRAAGRRRRERT